MKTKFTRIISRILLLGFMILMASMFLGCKSVKKFFEKKKESISLIEKNDVKFDQKIESNIKTFELDKTKKYSFRTKDSSKISRVVINGDSIEFENADLDIQHNDVATATEEDCKTEISGSDQSETSLDYDSKEIKEEVEKTGTSPALIWGGLLLVLIAGGVWYFRKSIPFI